MKTQTILLLATAISATVAQADLVEISQGTYNLGNNQWATITELQEASNQGNPLAQYAFAWALDEGKGIQENDAAADKLFAQAIAGLQQLAATGNAEAMAALGDIYEEGNGIAKDKKMAAEWFAKAVEKGHAYAMYCLADLYKDGEGVVKSLEKAKELYRAAAQKGYKKAEKELREIENGDDD